MHNNKSFEVAAHTFESVAYNLQQLNRLVSSLAHGVASRYLLVLIWIGAFVGVN